MVNCDLLLLNNYIIIKGYYDKLKNNEYRKYEIMRQIILNYNYFQDLNTSKNFLILIFHNKVILMNRHQDS